jgi:hypothetical protein
MPYTIRKVPNKKCYTVKKRGMPHKFSKCTSFKKAKKQIRLLNAIEHNPSFKPNR